ncbi:hypothetical protein [Prochlorococcus marinus]|uniref:ABC-type sugar transport system n=1 Tax=Prochlorococcus marinus (strain MIT 9211) TaxID=93059 RepID=A9BAN7_PROM4|nr:hypothetical protein [Prochlorococcus marinus]ABX08899.1 conserved hypothetical protein [Prochlorococcus marinus str. MIT 9211]
MPLILSLLVFFLFLEINHNFRKKSNLKITPITYNVIHASNNIFISGTLLIENKYKRIELMIPEISLKLSLYGEKDLSALTKEIKIIPKHNDMNNRSDYNWKAYIVKSNSSTEVDFTLNITDPSFADLTSHVSLAWVDVFWIDYGPSGRNANRSGFSLAITKPTLTKNTEKSFIANRYSRILPVKTHILGVLDDPIEVIKTYTKNIVNPSDIIIIGETPLSITQGNYFHPATIEPSNLAKILCRFFHPTSSLATACGMQSLINEVGPSRVTFAWIIGALLKLFRIKGYFYNLAGKQARLIDDITGTTPPYDQTIVLGPNQPQRFCDEAYKKLGINIAVVDANDLGRVKVLASSNKKLNPLLEKALISNPAGNGDEKTPILILRPY